MASVSLTTLWLCDAADLTDCQSFPYLNAKGNSPQSNVTLAEYAAGRVMATRTPLKAQQLAVTLLACTAEQTAWLESKAGVLLLVRDDLGRKFYGIYTTPGGTDHQYNTDADVTLVLNEVSNSEAV